MLTNLFGHRRGIRHDYARADALARELAVEPGLAAHQLGHPGPANAPHPLARGAVGVDRSDRPADLELCALGDPRRKRAPLPAVDLGEPRAPDRHWGAADDRRAAAHPQRHVPGQDDPDGGRNRGHGSISLGPGALQRGV